MQYLKLPLIYLTLLTSQTFLMPPSRSIQDQIRSGNHYGKGSAGNFVINWSEISPLGLPITFYSSGAYLYAGTSGNGIFRSSTDGQSWEPSSNGLVNGAKVQAFASIGGGLITGTDQGAWMSNNLGQMWNPLNSGFPSAPASRSITKFEVSGNSIYAEVEAASGTLGNKIYLLSNLAANWTEIKLNFPVSSGRLLIAVNGRTLYVQGQSKVYRSMDNGQTWSPLDFGAFQNVLAINGTLVFASGVAGTGVGIWRSTDLGEHWVQLRINSSEVFGGELIGFSLSGTYVFALTRSCASPSACSTRFIYSSDLGQTWNDSDGPPTNPPPMGTVIYFFQIVGSKAIALRSDLKFLISTNLISPRVTSVSAASYTPVFVSPESIVAAFGTGLSLTTEVAKTIPLPTTIANLQIKVKDTTGSERLAPLFYVSPNQVNYQIPSGTLEGVAIVTFMSNNVNIGTETIIVRNVVPGLFTAGMNGAGGAAAVALRIKADGKRSYEQVAKFDASINQYITIPIDLGDASDQVYLLLYGTGFQNLSSLMGASVKIGDVDTQVTYAGRQGDYVGLDQVNVLIPRNLIGKGEADVLFIANSTGANVVRVNIK